MNKHIPHAQDAHAQEVSATGLPQLEHLEFCAN